MVTMTSRWTGQILQKQREASPETREATASTRPVTPTVPVLINPELRVLLDRHDDRLLHDIGLRRDSVLGEMARFWSEWSRRRDPWHL